MCCCPRWCAHRLRCGDHADQRAVFGHQHIAAAHQGATGQKDAQLAPGRVGSGEAAFLAHVPVEFDGAGSQRAALFRSKTGHRRMQASPHLAGRTNPRQQAQLLAIHAQVRRTHQAPHIGYTNRDIRLAVTAAGLHRIVVCGEGRLHLAVPAVHRHLEQAHFALARQHLAAHLQRRRHLQPVPLGDLYLGLLDAQRVDQFNLLAFHPWHHPHRARCLRAQLLDLQAGLAHLHGKGRRRILQRQAQARCPLLGLRLVLARQRLDPDTAVRQLLHRSPSPHKKIK